MCQNLPKHKLHDFLGSALPFYKCSDEEMLDDTLDLSASLDSGLDIHPLCSNSGQLKIMHLNTQSMVSTFNELLLTVNSYPLDIVALSETWLRDQPQLLDYVSIPGFVTKFRNREGIRGGGVGVYIREISIISAVVTLKMPTQNLNPFG